VAEPKPLEVPWFGKALYYFFPYRRTIVLETFCASSARFARSLKFGFWPRPIADISFDFYSILFARRSCRGSAEEEMCASKTWSLQYTPINRAEEYFFLTGHFGKFRGRDGGGHPTIPAISGTVLLYQAILETAWFNSLVTCVFAELALARCPKRGSLDKIVELLGKGAM
jgi:hypothetical protein